MANRDHPVNGRRAKLSLLRSGNLILTDAAQFNVWHTGTASSSSVLLQLNDYGNLILSNRKGIILWQSFDFPTDTLIPLQLLTRHTTLVSRRRKGNYSSGFYKFFFDDDNVLRLLFDGPEISSVYWPAPWLLSWEADRSTYNSWRNATIDSFGNFSSSDDLIFRSKDYGEISIQRRLTIDYDGNHRMYSREERNETWFVSWQAIRQPLGFMVFVGKIVSVAMLRVLGGNALAFKDTRHFRNTTLKECETECLQRDNYKGFQYKFNDGFYECYPKALLRNGHQISSFNRDVEKYLFQESSLNCSENDTIKLERSYAKSQENGIVKFMLWFASAFGGVEIISIFLVWLFLNRARQEKNVAKEGYLLAATGIKRFAFDELREAT
ncbi:hypothetical protein REPUB_Repub19eG0051200 [Reevesia pubescens]